MGAGERSVKWLLVACAAISALVFCEGEASGSSTLDLNSTHVPWSRLRFLASSGMGSADTDIRLTPISAAQLERSLRADGDSPPTLVPDADVLRMTVVTETTSKLPLTSDKTWRTEVWFLPGDASALQRTRLKVGKDPDAKTFRYFPNGVQRVRSRPKNAGEAKRPPRAWTKSQRAIYTYGPASAGCPQVLDPATLLYVISVAEMTRGDPPLELCVFNKKALYGVDIRVTRAARIPARFTQRRGATEEQVETELDVQTIVISSRPLQPVEQEPEPFEFFEMRGDVQIAIDPATRLPVRVRGTIKNVGEVTFKLIDGDLVR